MDTYTFVLSIATIIIACVGLIANIKRKNYSMILFSITIILLSIGHFFPKWIAIPILVISIVLSVIVCVLWFEKRKK